MSDGESLKESFCRSKLFLTTPYVRPETETEVVLSEIWQDVLAVDVIGTQDDFFEIGGDSLTATVLASELENRFVCKFSPSSMIEYSTVTAQASYLTRQQESRSDGIDAERPSCLTLLNAEGTASPLFLLPGARGFTLYHRSFLNGFDSDQPIGFLEAPGLDGQEAPLESLQEYAKYYFDVIRQTAPEGNWQIASNCSGGFIAHEICLLAAKCGERVSRLMLIDPLVERKENGLGRRVKRKGLRRNYRAWKRRWMNFFRYLRGGNVENSEDEGAAFSASVEEFAQRHKASQKKKDKKNKQVLYDQIESTGTSFVPSRVAYNPEAMLGVGKTLARLYRSHILHQKWEGATFILSTSKRSKSLILWREYFPNALFRVVQYDHRDLFTEGLSDVVTFLNDAMAEHPEEHF